MTKLFLVIPVQKLREVFDKEGCREKEEEEWKKK